MGAAGIGLWLTQPPQPDPAWPDAENTVVAPAAGDPSALGDETRPNYPYSIVEGGVHASSEMRQAIERDSVVAAHYAGLDPSQFRVERLPVRTEAHVSYRIGKDVFWTRKKLVLQAGEKVLTDGTNIIRARCGNRVSMEELGPVRRQEPAAEAFEQMSRAGCVRSRAADGSFTSGCRRRRSASVAAVRRPDWEPDLRANAVWCWLRRSVQSVLGRSQARTTLAPVQIKPRLRTSVRLRGQIRI